MKSKDRANGARSREPSRDFSSGDDIPRSGIYATAHPHRLSAHVHLLQGHIFPSCAHCHSPILFKLITPLMIESASARFRLLMSK